MFAHAKLRCDRSASAPVLFPPPPPDLHLFTTSCTFFFRPICFGRVLSSSSGLLTPLIPSQQRCSSRARRSLTSRYKMSVFHKLEHLLHGALRAAVFHCLLCLGFLEGAGSVPARREDTTPVFSPLLTAFIDAMFRRCHQFT